MDVTKVMPYFIIYSVQLYGILPHLRADYINTPKRAGEKECLYRKIRITTIRTALR